MMSMQLNVTLQQLHNIHVKTAKLLDKIEVLEEVFREFLVEESMKPGTTLKLLLVGVAPTTPNPIGFVRSLMLEKLALLQFDDNILTATPTANGIVFELRTLFDKKRVLYRSRDKLVTSQLKIVDFRDNVGDTMQQQPSDAGTLDVRMSEN